jgi:hypothetical protein
VDAITLHEIWIGLLIQIVSPVKRRMVSCKDWVGVALVNAVTLDRLILLGDESLVLCLKQASLCSKFIIEKY